LLDVYRRKKDVREGLHGKATVLAKDGQPQQFVVIVRIL